MKREKIERIGEIRKDIVGKRLLSFQQKEDMIEFEFENNTTLVFYFKPQVIAITKTKRGLK